MADIGFVLDLFLHMIAASKFQKQLIKHFAIRAKDFIDEDRLKVG